MKKPRIKAGRVTFFRWPHGHYCYVAYFDRLGDHPKLGPPRCESQSRSSMILRIDFEKKEFETLNSIYWWED